MQLDRMKEHRDAVDPGFTHTHLFGGKHHEDFGNRMGVSGCPVCPSTVLMDGLGYRLMPCTVTPPTLVLLALLMLALEPDEE